MRCPRCRPTPIRRGSPRTRSSPSAAISAARPTPCALAALQRERPSCTRCGSNVRFRAMAHLLITELLGAPAVLDDLPPHARTHRHRPVRRARPTRSRWRSSFGYENTWFHTEPRLDIANVAAELAGRYDFLVASDVFEHVVPPVARAFANARRMLLKPGGVFVFTRPVLARADDTVEHFPELHDFRVAEEDGRWTAAQPRRADGRAQTFDRPRLPRRPGLDARDAPVLARRAGARVHGGGIRAACASRPSPTCRSASSGPSPGRCRWSPAPDLVRTAVGDEQGQASGDRGGARAARARRRVHPSPVRVRGARRHRGVGARAGRRRARGDQDADHGGRREAAAGAC